MLEVSQEMPGQTRTFGQVRRKYPIYSRVRNPIGCFIGMREGQPDISPMTDDGIGRSNTEMAAYRHVP